MTLYDFPLSGNCYKVRLLLSQLQAPYRRVHVDRVKGETRLPEYLEKNPAGKVPLLEIEPGVYLPESNAILCYLAEGTSFLPTERLARARVLQWLFFEQSMHMPNIAVARYWVSVLKKEKEMAAQLDEKHSLGYRALDVMEKHLAKHAFFVDDSYSVADISLYAYTHLAEEGKFDLGRFPAVREWLARVASQPGHVTLLAGS